MVKRWTYVPRSPWGVALLVVLLFSLPAAANEPSEDEIRLRAEAAFREGVQLAPKAPDKARQAFARSAALYDRLRVAGAANAELFRNQGNAYLLADDLPRAIFAYRRGLRLEPNDLALHQNLVHAREEVKFPPPGTLGRPPVDHRPPWLPRLAEWTPWLVLGLYALACLAFVRWRMVRRGRWLTVSIGALLLAGLVAAGVGYEQWQDDRDERQPLVVIAEDGVFLRRGNGFNYPPRHETPLHRGVEARLLFERGPWLQIELAKGEIGWVPAGYVVIDR